jgi:sugar phosphate isomerase/epimerase
MTQEISRRTVIGGMAAMPVLASSLASCTPPTPKAVARVTPNIGLPSRHFQFTDSIQKAVQLCKQAGYDCMEWNVRFGGHVDPEKVEQLLPAAVEASDKAGLKVEQVCTNINRADTPNAERILKTMQSLGIRYYRSSNYFQYDLTSPGRPQLEALKALMKPLADLNAKYGTTACFHTHASPADVGGAAWDLMYMFRDVAPNLIGFNYDVGHTTLKGGANHWMAGMLASGKYIQAVALKDPSWKTAAVANDTAAPRPTTSFGPMGENGLCDLRGRFAVLRDIGYKGPYNIHFEYAGLYGTAIGTMKLDYSEEEFVRVIKRDLDYARAAMRDAELFA